MSRAPIRVLIVDDSELIRRLLTEILNSDPAIAVVGRAEDAFEAKKLVKELSPDVITLDVEMPEIDGIRFLEVLMKARPTPVIMISTLTQSNADVTLKALELGAVDYLAKPVVDDLSVFNAYERAIISKVKMAANSRVKQLTHRPSKSSALLSKANRVLAIGASTGGTEAIHHLLLQLPASSFALVITQHMPAGFTTTYAERLNRTTDFTVIEAKGGELLKPGYAYLAPGGLHLAVKRKGSELYTEVFDSQKVSGHKPSVDVLFRSVAEQIGKFALATILTGMGKDGAQGLKSIRDAGGYTVAQDEESCVVFGMPRVAIESGAACAVTPLDAIGEQLVASVNAPASTVL